MRFKESLTAPHREPAGDAHAARSSAALPGQRARGAAGCSRGPSSSVCWSRSARTATRCRARRCWPSAEEVVARGISLEAALGVFEELDRHCDAVARAFVKLFVEQVWRPFQRADMPAERWPEIDEAIERLRPLASDALLAIFQRRMQSQIEAAFGEMTERLSERRGREHERCLREQMLARWERAAKGWGKHADRLREHGMPVSAWMIDHAQLQPGQRVLELAAGPGDTGFLAAELIAPGGTLVSAATRARRCSTSPGSGRERSESENVEFARLELEWIDLAAASVDAVLCRWGVMLLRRSRGGAQGDSAGAPAGRAGGARGLGSAPSETRGPRSPARALIELGHASHPIRARRGCSRSRGSGPAQASCSSRPGSSRSWSTGGHGPLVCRLEDVRGRGPRSVDAVRGGLRRLDDGERDRAQRARSPRSPRRIRRDGALGCPGDRSWRPPAREPCRSG